MDFISLERICKAVRRDLLINDGVNPDAPPDEDDGQADPRTVHASEVRFLDQDGNEEAVSLTATVAGWPVDADGLPPPAFRDMVLSLFTAQGLDLAVDPVRIEFA